MKKFITMLLVCAMMCTNITWPNGLDTVQAETAQTIRKELYVNPLYKDVIDGADVQCNTFLHAIVPVAESEYTSDLAVVGETMRDAMVERADSVIVYYAQKGQLEEGFLEEWLEAALVETDNPKAGDYLRWHYRYIHAQGLETKYTNGVYQYTIQVTFIYYTTAEQEKALDQEVADVLEEIGVSESLSDYENAKKIYDYICANITYDFANLEDASYTLKYSAYAAMVNKTAVCQGYATLFYYMAQKVGLDVRVIAGDTMSGAHAWNIVRLGNVYYYLDSTWDAEKTKYQYFLKGADHFTDHVSFEMYTTSEFISAYPISKTDYVPNLNVSVSVELEKDAYQYTGNHITPPVSVKVGDDILIEGTDYTVTYKNNIEIGDAIAEIVFINQYGYIEKMEKRFHIYKAPITNLTIKLSKDKYVYDGNVKTPSVTVTTPNGTRLVEGIDYWLTYDQNRIDVGTYYVKVTIDNNYRGAIRLYFDIVPQGEWIQDRVGWWYKRADGTYPYGGWALIDGDWYYFNQSGYRVTGWIYSGGVWYYLMEQGTNRPETEGVLEPDLGKMLHSVWFGDKDGNKYYFQANGAMTTGWFYYNQDWYYFNSSGALQTGWELINGTWYYFEEYGEMVTGWQFIGGAWYYFNGSGAMVTGWQLIGGTWYYLHESGAMAANQWVGNYYLQADGSMAVNKRIGVYYVGADGAWIPGV